MSDIDGPPAPDEMVFEASYRARLGVIMNPLGTEIKYELDLAGIDVGYHLYSFAENGQRSMSPVRIWFQGKGVHVETMSADDLRNLTYVIVPIRTSHLRLWNAMTEPVYIVVYLEALDRFVAAEAITLVTREPTLDQQEVSLRVPTNAVLNPDWVANIAAEYGDIDLEGPSFRGNRLGHQLDPYRSRIAAPDPTTFTEIVVDILVEHGFDSPIVASEGTAQLRVGYLGTTYELTNPMFTEFCTGPEALPRIESPMQGVQGRIAVIIDGAVDGRDAPDDKAINRLLRVAVDAGVETLLAFVSIDELTAKGERYRHLAQAAGLAGRTQGLGGVTFSLLTMASVWRKYRAAVRWAIQNRLQPVHRRRSGP
jgi:hypothetical protein